MRKVIVVAMLAMFGCGDDTQPTINITKMEVTPGTFIVAAGKNKRVIAELVADNGQRFDVSGTATWASSNEAIVKALSGGNIVGVGAGMATISASRDGQTGSAMVMITSSQIVSIAVTPGSSTVPKGGTTQLTATAKLMDNSMVDITQTAMWTSNNMAAVKVSKGLVMGIEFGQATVNAVSDAIMSNGVRIYVGDAPPDGPVADGGI